MKYIKNFFWLYIAIPCIFGLNSTVLFASIIPDPNGNVRNLPGGNDGADITTSIIPAIIKIIFSLLGVGITVLIIYAGYLHITNFGDEEQVKKANHLLYWAIVGIALISFSYALIDAVIQIEW